MADGRRLNLLAHGRVVNLAAAEGTRAVMDVSFALQALGVEELVRGGVGWPRACTPCPPPSTARWAGSSWPPSACASMSPRPSRSITGSPGARPPEPPLTGGH